TGAYAFAGPGIAANGAGRATGIYRVPHLRVESYCVYTNKAVCSAFRAPGTAQTNFAIESHIDALARRLGLDPLEMRMKNMLQEGDKGPGGLMMNNIYLKETIEAAVNLANFKEEKQQKNRGKGMGVAFWQTGGMASSACVKLNEDGTVGFTTGAVDVSGSHTSLQQMLAEVMGIERGDVVIQMGDTDTAPHSPQSGGSQITRSVGASMLRAAEEVRRKIFELAAELLEANIDDLELRAHRVSVKGSPHIGLTLKEVAQKSHQWKKGPILGEASHSSLPAVPSFCTEIAEVEVDPETGQVDLLRMICALDVGMAINPLQVEGQIEGGVVQGIGYALSEEIVYGEDGRVKNPNFLDYKIPVSLDVPKIESVLIERPTHIESPFGMKGVGEPPIVPTAAAIANAVYDAIGVRVHDLPITADKIVKALKEKSENR
ncbi:MAG: molybdopterin-dependent oxidoreductase, partial [Candidatus Tectomicrobia bacterium]|nr:molybdopterin-dependent oxidoreductase [Candidatus Tectomicrobia bacterium]